jgi:hypothetical protein
MTSEDEHMSDQGSESNDGGHDDDAGGTRGPYDDDHRVLARLVVDGAEDIAAFGRRFREADSATDDERALLGWVLLRVEQIVEQILDGLR